MMDAVYFLRHSQYNDLELLYSLRSIARYAPWLGKVWIFGDRPSFLSSDVCVIEHVPHEYVARVGDFRTPVKNLFLSFYLASLIPELSSEFLWFADDYVLLDELSEADARQARYLQDLNYVTSRGRGMWKDALWRTYDLLKRLGYLGLNFEAHTPLFLTKKRVLEAYCEFKDYVTEDRWYGPLGITAILNHAYKYEQMPLIKISDEGRYAGFHHKASAYDDIAAQCRGKTFLNFDDEAFGHGMQRYLAEQFDEPCIYEREFRPVDGPSRTTTEPNAPHSADDDARQQHHDPPAVVLASRRDLPTFLTRQGLIGEAAEIGTSQGKFAALLLETWKGSLLHCVDTRQEPSSPKTDNSSNDSDDMADLAQRLAPFGRRCEIMQLSSRAAAERFGDRTLDFVYLADPRLRSTLLEDLDLWVRKIRTGGWLAGVSEPGENPAVPFDIQHTVDEWSTQQGLELLVTGETADKSWMLQIV